MTSSIITKACLSFSLFNAHFVKTLPYLRKQVFFKKVRQTFVTISLLCKVTQKCFEIKTVGDLLLTNEHRSQIF